MDERVNDFMKEINDILPDNGNSSGGKHKRSRKFYDYYVVLRFINLVL